MAYEIQDGLAGLGVNEFPQYQTAPAKKQTMVVASTALRSQPVIGKTAVVLAPLTGKTGGGISKTPVVPPSLVPATVNQANESDPTAPPPDFIGANTPDPYATVVIAPPAPSGLSPLAVGAGLLVATGVALWFITRKGS
jgi:hypothetical protein